VGIRYTQAALGAEITVDTLDGPVKLKIPAGTQTGTAFRLRGRGVPRVRGVGRGDHLVRVEIEVPTRLTAAQRELLERLAQLEEGGDSSDARGTGARGAQNSSAERGDGERRGEKTIFERVRDAFGGR